MKAISAQKAVARSGRHDVLVRKALDGPRDAARKRLERYQAPSIQLEINRLEERFSMATDTTVRCGCLRAIAYLTRIKSAYELAEAPGPQLRFEFRG